MTIEEKERFKRALLKAYYQAAEQNDEEEMNDLIDSAKANGIDLPIGKQEYIDRSITMTGTDGYIINQPEQRKRIR